MYGLQPLCGFVRTVVVEAVSGSSPHHPSASIRRRGINCFLKLEGWQQPPTSDRLPPTIDGCCYSLFSPLDRCYCGAQTELQKSERYLLILLCASKFEFVKSQDLFGVARSLLTESWKITVSTISFTFFAVVIEAFF